MANNRRRQTNLAQSADAARGWADRLESRPARQEAEYQAAQQRRREEGGLSRLAMVPEAVRRAQMRVMDRVLAGEDRKVVGRARAEANELERQFTDSLSREGYAKGGMVRGVRSVQKKGKKFSGSF
jgi:hypothetical protein